MLIYTSVVCGRESRESRQASRREENIQLGDRSSYTSAHCCLIRNQYWPQRCVQRVRNKRSSSIRQKKNRISASVFPLPLSLSLSLPVISGSEQWEPLEMNVNRSFVLVLVVVVFLASLPTQGICGERESRNHSIITKSKSNATLTVRAAQQHHRQQQHQQTGQKAFECINVTLILL